MKKLWMILVPFILLIFLAQPAMAELTISNMDPVSVGNKKGYMLDVAFDSSYAFGGESLTGTSVGMVKIDRVIVEGKDGYVFQFDHTNNKLRAFRKAPPIVYEEQHTATATAGITLDYPAAWILNVVDSSGNNCQWMYSGATTLTTNQFATQSLIADGERTGVTVDAADTYYITYATQAWKDLYDLLVQNEALTMNAAASGASVLNVASGQTIFAFGTMRAGATTYTPVDFYDTPLASEVGVDFGRSGTSTSYLNIPVNGTTTYAWITYLKYPASGTWLRDRYISGVSFGATEGAVTGTSTLTVPALKGPILTWNYSGFVPSVGETTMKLVRPSDAVSAANTIKWNYPNPTMTISSSANLTMPMYGYNFLDPSSGVTPTNVAFTWGYPYEIPNLQPLEVANGTDLSDLSSVKVLVIGY